MKLLLPFLSLGLASAALPIYGNSKTTRVDDIKVDSALGSKIMANARKLENADEIDFTWVADFSIKFQGCHHVSQWNDDAEGEDEVRIQTKRLIRFRLCPTNSCSVSSAAGCNSDYGDYVIDMNTFLESYYEAVEKRNEWQCEYTAQMKCGCDDENQGDDYNQEYCEYDCFVANNLADTCVDRNPYEEDGEEQEKFELRDYVECKEAEFRNDEERRLEDEEVQYFVGPYCAEQGGSIYLGLFTDDTCTTFADGNGGASTYKQLAGESLPYSGQSIVTMDCLSCKEPEDFNNDGNDAEDEDEVAEMCEQIYETAGKCESGLEATGYVYEANKNACNYITGIKVVRKNGIITQVGPTANKTASIFIGMFVVAFVLLASYVYYLKTKLDRASINLSE